MKAQRQQTFLCKRNRRLPELAGILGLTVLYWFPLRGSRPPEPVAARIAPAAGVGAGG